MSELLDQLPERERQVVTAAREVAMLHQTAAYLVGGPVRDLLLGRVPLDLDFCLEKDAEAFARSLGDRIAGTVSLFPQFMTCKIESAGLRPIDVTTTRKETYPHPGSLPVVSPAGLEEDLFRRDFTVNAMALDLVSGELIDHFHGEDDLRRAQIRVLHEASFEDDPTRIYRAIRLAVRLGFTIEQHTRELKKAALERNASSTVSRERLWRELFLAFEEEDCPRVIAEFMRVGLIAPIVGRTDVSADIEDRLETLLSDVTEAKGDRAVAVLAALHGTSEPVEEKLAGSGLSHKEIETIRSAVRDLPQLLERLRGAATERESLRACAGVPEEILSLAVATDSAVEPAVNRCRAFRSFEVGLRGSDLGVAPGPHVGRALAATREAVFLGEISRDDAPAFARRIAQEYLEEK